MQLAVCVCVDHCDANKNLIENKQCARDFAMLSDFEYTYGQLIQNVYRCLSLCFLSMRCSWHTLVSSLMQLTGKLRSLESTMSRNCIYMQISFLIVFLCWNARKQRTNTQTSWKPKWPIYFTNLFSLGSNQVGLEINFACTLLISIASEKAIIVSKFKLIYFYQKKTFHQNSYQIFMKEKTF